jgi:acyl-CoA dehydrogenase
VSQEQSTAEQADDARMIIDLVAKFVDQELMPLEAAVIAREIKAEPLKLLPAAGLQLNDLVSVAL